MSASCHCLAAPAYRLQKTVHTPSSRLAEKVIAEAMPYLEPLARCLISTECIVEEIERLRAGRTRFVDAALADTAAWAPNAKLPAADAAPEPFGAEFDEIDPVNPLGFLDDDKPPVDQPHSSVARAKAPRRIGVRRP